MAPSNPYKDKIEGDGLGCFKCEAKRCDCCKNFLISGSRFRSGATGREFKIDKSLTCTSANIVYLAQCVSCSLQGVGSSVDFKKRLVQFWQVIMADSHANECSVNSDLNTLLNYSETKNLHEEKNYPDRNDVLLSKSKLHLYWSRDFASLKHFVCNVIKLQGSWSQPGGDKKVFSGDVFSITWRKSKRMLKFDGERSNELKRLFCNELCDAQNSSQVGYEDEPVNQSCEGSSCKCLSLSTAALSQSEEISSDFCCFYGGGIRHNEDIMHSFQNFIVRLIPNHPPPLETRIWKLVVRALVYGHGRSAIGSSDDAERYSGE